MRLLDRDYGEATNRLSKEVSVLDPAFSEQSLGVIFGPLKLEGDLSHSRLHHCNHHTSRMYLEGGSDLPRMAHPLVLLPFTWPPFSPEMR